MKALLKISILCNQLLQQFDSINLFSLQSFWWCKSLGLPSCRTSFINSLRRPHIKVMEFTKNSSCEKVSCIHLFAVIVIFCKIFLIEVFKMQTYIKYSKWKRQTCRFLRNVMMHISTPPLFQSNFRDSNS